VATENKGRIYRTLHKPSQQVRYVRALTNIGAKSFIADDTIEVEIATPEMMLEDGITKDKIENALSASATQMPLAGVTK